MNTIHTTSPALQERTTTAVAAQATLRPYVGRAVKAPNLQSTGEDISVLLTTKETNGRVIAGSALVEPNGGPPPHIHEDAEEIFLVQSGAFEILIKGELIEARAGDVVYLARGEAHRFRGLDSGQPNRFFVIIAPGDFEYFFKRWVALFENGMPDMQQAVALAGEYNILLYPSDDLAPAAPANPQSKTIPFDATPKPVPVFDTHVTVLLDASETRGRYSLVRVEGWRDSSHPVHVNEDKDELFLIEAGQVEFTLGEDTVTVEEGDLVWVPRGWAHSFRIQSEQALMAIFTTPGETGDVLAANEPAMHKVSSLLSPTDLFNRKFSAILS